MVAGRKGDAAAVRFQFSQPAGRRIRGPGARALIAVPLILLIAAACGSETQPSPSDGPAATRALSTSTPSPTVEAVSSLREVDVEALEFVAELISLAGGGEVHAERVHFEDLTGDGREEAVVVVESGGTAGDIAVAVYGLREGIPDRLFFQPLSGHVEVRVGLVVIQEGVYAAGEPRCCPSRLRESAYGWQGGAFTLVSEQVVENPSR